MIVAHAQKAKLITKSNRKPAFSRKDLRFNLDSSHPGFTLASLTVSICRVSFAPIAWQRLFTSPGFPSKTSRVWTHRGTLFLSA